MEKPVTEFRGFHITLGFVLQLLITLVAIGVAFATMRSDTMAALAEIAKQEHVIEQQGTLIIDMRMQLQHIADRQEYFQMKYEDDMNKYIREIPKH